MWSSSLPTKFSSFSSNSSRLNVFKISSSKLISIYSCFTLVYLDELSFNPLFPEAFIYDLSLSESNLKAYGDGSEDSKVLELFLAYADTLYECLILIT